MNKLKSAAIATSLFVAGSYGAFEADKSLNKLLAEEKIECHTKTPQQAEACVDDIDTTHESEYFLIEALELWLLIGAIGSGVQLVKNLRPPTAEEQQISELNKLYENS